MAKRGLDTNLYEPASDALTPFKIRLCLEPFVKSTTPSVSSVILALVEADFQLTVGFGLPLAVQVTLTSLPSKTV